MARASWIRRSAIVRELAPSPAISLNKRFIRSIAQNRLTAVGRVAARVFVMCLKSSCSSPGFCAFESRTPRATPIAAASHNLDGWMLPREANESLFARATADKDGAIVEGVMGLFDGFDGKSERGSTAEMAVWLGLPVIVVIDAHAMARSAAAIVKGLKE